MLACDYIALTSRVGLLWPRHTAQLAFSGLEYDNRTKLFWTLNLTIGHSEIYMRCPLVPCSHVVADSGKILLEPSKTFCHNCSTMSCQSCPWGHEMGGNHSGKTCLSPDYAKGFTAHVTITVYTTAWKIMPAKGYKCDQRTIGGHYLCQKQHSIHMTGMARQLSQYWVLVKNERRTSSSSSLPPASFAVEYFGLKWVKIMGWEMWGVYQPGWGKTSWFYRWFQNFQKKVRVALRDKFVHNYIIEYS